MVVIKITRCCFGLFVDFFDKIGSDIYCQHLSSKAVESPALTLECVYDIEGSDGLATCVLGVGDSVADDIFEEHLQDAAGLFVDKTRNALDATTDEPADG